MLFAPKEHTLYYYKKRSQGYSLMCELIHDQTIKEMKNLRWNIDRFVIYAFFDSKVMQGYK